ncbi:uncharacterized protein LOC121393321 [Xenopus laevis]|uniref:Uncharacterized protein LOC121393321 n=1 Tax=Xenopus laevis TaxID=8355 RepID=A0A8J1KMH9_XENLA|nr:uncharacterized protein LOC121393321 [Xenopus laevis]
MTQQTQLEHQALTFTYNEEQAARIIGSNTGSNTFLLSLPNSDVIKEYEKESRKLIGLDLHAITLTEYYRAGRIPRGLRVNLRPTIFNDNEEFTQKYEQIVNKCSFDIILLNIEFLQKEIANTKQRLQIAEGELKKLVPSADQRDCLSDIQDHLSKHRAAIEERKRHKFLRDEADYTAGRVYKWQRGSGMSETPRRPFFPREYRPTRPSERREQRAYSPDRRGYRQTRSPDRVEQWTAYPMDRREEQTPWRGYRRNERDDDTRVPLPIGGYGGSTSDASSSSSFLGYSTGQSTRKKGGAAGDIGGYQERREQPYRKARTHKKRQ